MYNIKEAQSQNSFLGKVFMTLALTMIPTVLGLFAGMNMIGVLASMGVMFPIVSLIVLIGLIFAVSKFRDSTMGFALLFLFTFVMGITISLNILAYLASPEGVMIVTKAFVTTIILFFIMGMIGAKTKRDLSSLGTILFVALIALIIASIVNLFLHSTMMSFILSAVGAVIFSLFIMYDINKIVKGQVTSVTQATMALYIDFVNLFLNLLSLFGLSKN